MAKRQVKVYQIILLLFLSRIFTIISYNPTPTSSFGATTAILGMLAGFIVVLLFFLPGYFLIKRNSLGGETSDLCMSASKVIGKGSIIINSLYFLFFVGIAGYTVSNFELFITTAIYPNASHFLIVVLLILAACYGVFMGIESLSRVAIVIFAFFMISMVFIFLSLFPQIDWINLKQPFWSGLEQGMPTFIGGAMNSIAQTAELAALLFLFPHIIGDICKGVIVWDAMFIIKFILVTVFIVGVLGNLGTSQPFPFYTLTSMAEFSIFQRLDSLHVSIWVFIGYIKTTLFIYVASRVLHHMVDQKYQKYAPWISTGATLLLALYLSDNIQNLNFANTINVTGIPVFIFVVFIPGFLLIIDIIKNRKSKEEKKK